MSSKGGVHRILRTNVKIRREGGRKERLEDTLPATPGDLRSLSGKAGAGKAGMVKCEANDLPEKIYRRTRTGEKKGGDSLEPSKIAWREKPALSGGHFKSLILALRREGQEIARYSGRERDGRYPQVRKTDGEQRLPAGEKTGWPGRITAEKNNRGQDGI